jgi:hypothetical protein
VVAEVWVHASARDEGLDEVYALWDRVNAEDRAVCERAAARAARGAGGRAVATPERRRRAGLRPLGGGRLRAMEGEE